MRRTHTRRAAAAVLLLGLAGLLTAGCAKDRHRPSDTPPASSPASGAPAGLSRMQEKVDAAESAAAAAERDAAGDPDS